MSSFDHFLSRINSDFNIGYHHFEPSHSDSVANLFERELALFSRRFRVDDKEGVTILSLDLPGFKSSDLDIKLERNILRVIAKNTDDEFEASLNVGRDVDPDKVEAALDLGVLTIKLHKLASSKARSIKVT